MGKRKKALFITHDVNNYGASRSLQTLLANMEDTDIDLVVKKRLRSNRDLQEVRNFFFSKVNSIEEFYLPHPNIYKGGEWKEYVVKINDLCWKLNANALYKYIRKNNYDYIHLNSIVLHQLVREDLPFFIHIREIFNHTDPSVNTSLQKATGVIFIDDATEKPFLPLSLQNSTILNNPFDMRHLPDLETSDVISQYALENKTIFSIIGSISPVKGVDLAIKAFKAVQNPDAILLIVGTSTNKAYIKECETLAREDSRILFYGEEPEIGKIYAVSDYILRCDPQFCVGRTVYEGLYAGCHIILPGQEQDRAALFDMEAFTDNIALYPPQSINALAKIITLKSNQKISEKKYSTNIQPHLQKFNQFIDSKIS